MCFSLYFCRQERRTRHPAKVKPADVKLKVTASIRARPSIGALRSKDKVCRYVCAAEVADNECIRRQRSSQVWCRDCWTGASDRNDLVRGGISQALDHAAVYFIRLCIASELTLSSCSELHDQIKSMPSKRRRSQLCPPALSLYRLRSTHLRHDDSPCCTADLATLVADLAALITVLASRYQHTKKCENENGIGREDLVAFCASSSSSASAAQKSKCFDCSRCSDLHFLPLGDIQVSSSNNNDRDGYGSGRAFKEWWLDS